MTCFCSERSKKISERRWKILQYHCNYSAFHGYRYNYSDYSCIRCEICGAVWRTNAKYVDKIKR